jgi:hypothetical protein
VSDCASLHLNSRKGSLSVEGALAVVGSWSVHDT